MRIAIEVIPTSVQKPPKGVLVVVAGGVAKYLTGGDWRSGINGRLLAWEPKWWAPIPGDNVDPVAKRRGLHEMAQTHITLNRQERQ